MAISTVTLKIVKIKLLHRYYNLVELQKELIKSHILSIMIKTKFLQERNNQMWQHIMSKALSLTLNLNKKINCQKTLIALQEIVKHFLLLLILRMCKSDLL